jgi:hypothetical protein
VCARSSGASPLDRAVDPLLACARLSSYPDGVSVLDVDPLPNDPLDSLKELARRESELGRMRRAAIEAARAAGATWEQVGSALGMSRQAAWEYYSRSARAALAERAADVAQMSDDEAMDLAVDEVRAARRDRRRA